MDARRQGWPRQGWPRQGWPRQRWRRQGWRRVAGGLRGLANPRVALPIIVAGALVAALTTLNDARAALRHVLDFPPGLLALYVALMLAYEALRTGQWLLWLRVLGIRAPLRVGAFAFLAGEGGQLLPAGNYLRTYLLRQAAGAPYASAVVATTATMWLEDAVALVAVIVLGVPGWGWLRPTAIGVLLALALAAAVAVGALRLGRRSARLSRRVAALRVRYPRLESALAQGGQLREAARLLARPWVVLAQTAFCVAYLALGASAFCLILQGLGLSQLTLTERLGVYAFSLAVGLFAPLPLDLGVIEASGVGALVACGVDPGVAVAAMLLQRALSSGVAMLVAGGAILVCRSERRATLAGPAHAAGRMAEHAAGRAGGQPERRPALEATPE